MIARLSLRRMASTNLMSLSKEEKKRFLDSFDTVISDCDGVLWHSKKPIPGAQEALKKLVSIGKRRYYFTNNTTITRKCLVKKINGLGFEAEEDDVLSTSWLTAKYLKNINFKKKIYLIGDFSLQEELNDLGIENFGAGADNFVESIKADNVPLDPEVGAVIIDYDNYFSYPKLLKAFNYLKDPDCLFISTSTDEKVISNEGHCIPGPGSYLAALQVCTKRKAIVMGKPSPFAIDNILVPMGLQPTRCLMIGDKCSTDIHFGNQRGLITLMVETGINKYADLENFKTSKMDHLLPSYYTSSLKDFLEIIDL